MSCNFYITLPFGGGKSFCLRCDSAFFQYMSNRKNKSSIQKVPRFCILSTQIHVLADVNLRFLRVIFYILFILLNPQSGCEFQEQVGWGTRLLFPKYCLDRKKPIWSWALSPTTLIVAPSKQDWIFVEPKCDLCLALSVPRSLYYVMHRRLVWCNSGWWRCLRKSY